MNNERLLDAVPKLSQAREVWDALDFEEKNLAHQLLEGWLKSFFCPEIETRQIMHGCIHCLVFDGSYRFTFAIYKGQLSLLGLGFLHDEYALIA